MISRLYCFGTQELFEQRANGSDSVDHWTIDGTQSLVRYRVLYDDLTSLASHRTLSSNKLTGEIPSTFGQLTALTVLNLFTNLLTGPIPSQVGRLTGLTALYVVAWLFLSRVHTVCFAPLLGFFTPTN
jgi:hypothetical protein